MNIIDKFESLPRRWQWVIAVAVWLAVIALGWGIVHYHI